jgi:hypothetical protein
MTAARGCQPFDALRAGGGGGRYDTLPAGLKTGIAGAAETCF